MIKKSLGCLTESCLSCIIGQNCLKIVLLHYVMNIIYARKNLALKNVCLDLSGAMVPLKGPQPTWEQSGGVNIYTEPLADTFITLLCMWLMALMGICLTKLIGGIKKGGQRLQQKTDFPERLIKKRCFLFFSLFLNNMPLILCPNSSSFIFLWHGYPVCSLMMFVTCGFLWWLPKHSDIDLYPYSYHECR